MEIRAAHKRTRQTYGPERLQRDLSDNGVVVGVHRIKRDSTELINKLKSMPKVEVYEVPAEEVTRWQATLMPYYDGMAKTWGDEWVRFQKISANLK